MPSSSGHNKNFFYLTGAYQSATSSTTQPSLTPIELKSLDDKIDDGKPNTGKILYNPYDAIDDAYSYYETAPTANSIACAMGGTDVTDVNVIYNANPATGGDNMNCQPIFVW
jgi:hypothetical protein